MMRSNIFPIFEGIMTKKYNMFLTAATVIALSSGSALAA